MKDQSNFVSTLFRPSYAWMCKTSDKLSSFNEVFNLTLEQAEEELKNVSELIGEEISLNDCEKYDFVRLISDKVAIYSGESFIIVGIDKDGDYKLLDWISEESDIDDDDYK